jgi:hypothetical protein
MRLFAAVLALALAVPAGAASTIVGANNIPVVWGETLPLPLTSAKGDNYITASENLPKFKFLRGGLTLRKLSANVIANSLTGSLVLRSRKNVANGGQSFTVTAGSTGHFSDASNSDSISTNDFVNAQYVAGGGSGDSATIGTLIAELATTSGPTVCVLGASYNNITQAAGLTRYTRVFGNLDMGSGAGTATESQATFLVYASGWVRALQVGYKQAITADTTVTLRKNGADTALAVSIPSGSAAGHYIDGSNAVRVARGDLINAKVVTGAGSGTLQLQTIALYIESDDNQCDIGVSGYKSIGGAGAQSQYFAILGDMQSISTSTSNHQATAPFATTVGQVRCLLRVGATGGNTGTVALRIAGSDSAALVSLPSGTASGWTSGATAAQASVSAGNLLDMHLSSAGTFNADFDACAMTINYDPTPKGGFVQAIE